MATRARASRGTACATASRVRGTCRRGARARGRAVRARRRGEDAREHENVEHARARDDARRRRRRARGRAEIVARAHGVETIVGALDAEAVVTVVRELGAREREALGNDAGEVVAAVAASAFATFMTSFMWEKAWKRRVFGSEDDEDESAGRGDGNAATSGRGGTNGKKRQNTTLHGVDVSRYPIFDEPEVLRALGFAATWHAGQRRKNGELYVKHCVESAKILAATLPSNGPKSRDAMCACLLHDVLDDTLCTEETLKSAFGARIFDLVVQVSRVGQMNEVIRRRRRDMVDGEVKSKLCEDDLAQLRKILLLIIRDPRVFLIKIADRLHNMRTIYAISDEKKLRVIAGETLSVWCSLSEKLGMWAIKSELEDLCFAVLEPESYDAIIAARDDAWRPAERARETPGVGRRWWPFSMFEALNADDAPETTKTKETDAFYGDALLASQYEPWQLDVKRRLASVPSFDWLSTQQGDSLQYENSDQLPASLVSSLNTLDRVRGSLWNELLIDGYDGSLNISVSSRLKSAYSTHLKMKRKNLPFNRICDARAMRIVVGEASTSETGTEREVDACYELTDLIHKLYRPIEGEYDDYITNPKTSGYRSLHTAVDGPDGAPFEVQVRTRAMHNAAEFGIAAQWMYKGKRKFASKSYQDAAQTDDVPEVGAGVQLVSGGRRSCGVVMEAAGSRMLVAEPMQVRWSDVTAWMAGDNHTKLMDVVRASGLTGARQGTSEFFISEFCYCVDQRWHRMDNLGHKTRVTAELVNPLDDVNEDDSWEEDVDDIDARIRQLQTVAGSFFDNEPSDEKAESLLGNWSATAAEIQNRRRAVAMRKKSAAREESWRSGDVEAPSLGILMAAKTAEAKPRRGIFQTEEAAKLEAEVALRNPNSTKNPNVDVEDGVMVITWNDAYDSPEVLSVRRGSTVAELADMLPDARGRVDVRHTTDASSTSSTTSTSTTTRPDITGGDDVQKKNDSVNVNMVMVPPTTKLKDGDMIFIGDSITNVSRLKQ